MGASSRRGLCDTAGSGTPPEAYCVHGLNQTGLIHHRVLLSFLNARAAVRYFGQFRKDACECVDTRRARHSTYENTKTYGVSSGAVLTTAIN